MVLDRYKIWPWSQQMEFLKPFLKFSNSNFNISKLSFLKPQESMDHIEEQQEEISQPLRETGPVRAPISATPVQPQQETPKISRKRKSGEASSQPTSVQQVLTYLEKRNNNSALEDIDLIMMGYARSIKQFSPRRQTMVKYKISQIVLEPNCHNKLKMTNIMKGRDQVRLQHSRGHHYYHQMNQKHIYNLHQRLPHPQFGTTTLGHL
ncbi:hypothetical protein CBL_20555 [Carabus blaptoides fortunei]